MPTRRICPNCRTPTFADGVTCRACRHDLEPSPAQGAPRPLHDVADTPSLREPLPVLAFADDDDSDLDDLPQHRKTIWLARLRKGWRTNALFITSVVCASLGWGAAVGVLTSMQQPRPAPASTSVNSVLTAGLAQKLHARDQELTSLMAQIRILSTQLDAARRAAGERAAEAVRADTARTSQLAELDAQSATLASLRAQVADLKNDNAGLEQNYNDLLNSLHRTQDETFRDEKMLVAAAAAEKRANDQVAAVKAAFARVSLAKYHKAR